MQVEPRLRGASPADLHGNAQDVVAGALVALLTGALIERGARVTPSLGESSLVWIHDGVEIKPAEIVIGAFADGLGRAVLREWSARLAA